MKIRINVDLLLMVGLLLGYVFVVLGTSFQQPLVVAVGVVAMFLCAGVMVAR